MTNYCKKHPFQRLTELFTSTVCDLCDPPKQAAPTPVSQEMADNEGLCRELDAAVAALNSNLSKSLYSPTVGLSFSDALKDNYPCSTASRIEAMTELIDAGILTVPDCRRLMDWAPFYYMVMK